MFIVLRVYQQSRKWKAVADTFDTYSDAKKGLFESTSELIEELSDGSHELTLCSFENIHEYILVEKNRKTSKEEIVQRFKIVEIKMI